jgi:non-heme chloroperoxidase
MIPQSFLDTVITESLRCPARVWRSVLAALLGCEPLSAARTCRAPAILIRGAEDAFVPHADQLKLRDALVSSRLFTLAGVGHAPHWEEPGNTADLLRAFVGELGDTGAFLRHAVFA